MEEPQTPEEKPPFTNNHHTKAILISTSHDIFSKENNNNNNNNNRDKEIIFSNITEEESGIVGADEEEELEKEDKYEEALNEIDKDFMDFCQNRFGEGEEEEEEIDEKIDKEEEEEVSDEKEEEVEVLKKIPDKKKTKRRKSDVLGVDVDEIKSLTSRKRRKQFNNNNNTNQKPIEETTLPSKRRVNPRISSQAAKIMGDANICWMSRNFIEAAKLTQEVIRLAPNLPDSYHLLGLIYSDLNNKKKALECFMISAYLNPEDLDLWKRVAGMSREQNQFRRALFCLKKVLKRDPGDVEAVWLLSLTYVDVHLYKRALEGFLFVLENNPNDVQVLIELGKVYLGLGFTVKAINTLEKTLSLLIAQKEVDIALLLEAVNTLMEIFMERKEYDKSLSVCQTYIRDPKNSQLPMKIKLNFLLSLLFYSHPTEVKDELRKFFQECEESGKNNDLCISAATLLLKEKYYDLASQAFQIAKKSPEYNSPEVWIEESKIYIAQGEESKAEQLLKEVLEIIPQHSIACSYLIDIYLRQSKFNEADALIRKYIEITEGKPLDLNLMIQLGLIEYALEKCDEFLKTSYQIIQDDCFFSEKRRRRKRRSKGHYRDKKKVMISSDETEGEIVPLNIQLPKLPGSILNTIEEREDYSPMEEINEANYLKLVSLYCKLLLKMGRNDDALSICTKTLSQAMYISDKEKLNDLRILSVDISLDTGKWENVSDSIRYACQSDPNNVDYWIVFNRLMFKELSSSSLIFAQTMQLRYPDNISLLILNGHGHLAGNFQHESLADYIRAYEKFPNDPEINLFLGVAYLNLAMNRLTNDKHSCILHAFIFLFRYKKFCFDKGENRFIIESNYNLGRAFHQVGINHLALHFYEQVLKDSSPLSECDNLKKETAYNLIQIYRENGSSPSLIQKLLNQYLRI